MAQLKKDASYNLTEIREEGIIGGWYEPSISANTWERLLPSGNTAALHNNDPEKIDIGSIRSDINSLVGWDFITLNEGSYQEIKVKSVEGSILQFAKGGIKGLTSGIEWTVRPPLVNSFIINYWDDATDNLEIGITNEKSYNPTKTKKSTLKPGKMAVIPAAQVELLFIRFPTITANADNFISWGEHYIP